MTNLYVDQAVATERIRALHVEAERYRLARSAHTPRARRSPFARLRAFAATTHLGPGYQPACC